MPDVKHEHHTSADSHTDQGSADGINRVLGRVRIELVAGDLCRNRRSRYPQISSGHERAKQHEYHQSRSNLTPHAMPVKHMHHSQRR
mgnify:CR=1 FL=1